MKKFATILLGLALTLGTATSFAQEQKTDEKSKTKKAAKKGHKGGKESKTQQK